MKRILLVAPMQLKFELTQDQSFLQLPLVKAKSFTIPLHLGTIAGLTPDEFEVELWDESVHGPIDEKTDLPSFDLVGVTGYTAHLPRARAIAKIVRQHGIPVAIGGPGISTNIQRYRNDFDICFLGEAELTWPQFLADWTKGKHRDMYRQIGPVDLTQSPIPRWDSIADRMQDYHIGGVQTSRGCPFDCEFCDVSYLFGRGTRYKSIENILAEVEQLYRLGMKRVIFCDDNFIGNRNYAKDLLRELMALNNSFERPLAFATELTIDVAKDEELMGLLSDANFAEIFIGIESPNKESLKETNKPQNYHSNLIEDLTKLQQYGISIRASFIVGFDSDTKNIFTELYDFVQEANLTVPSIRVLMAPPGTKLWQRLHREGRVLKTDQQGRYFGNPGTTNIIPNNMTRTELHQGYVDLIDRVYSWESFAERLKGFVRTVNRRPNIPRQKRVPWGRLLQLAVFLLRSADWRTRRIVTHLLWYTYRHAPWLVGRMVAIILRQYGYNVRPELKESIRRQIELEESGEYEMEIEEYESVIPDDFRVVYKRFFADVCHRVFRDIPDEARAEETLVEIFSDYLARGADESESMEQRKDYLMELASQIVGVKLDARCDVTDSQEKVTPEGSNAPLPIVTIDSSAPPSSRRIRKLQDAVIKAVEQERLIDSFDAAPVAEGHALSL